MTTAKVITRFAPSPTGFLHIGGARTALFNWLYARRMGGEFHLRIEDTDKARSTPQATQAILDGMAWLGLDHDGDVIYQSRNVDAHAAAAQTLLEKGAAYKCYCTPAELEILRNESRESGHALRSPWRDTNARSDDTPYTVRFRVPEGQTKIHDHVQGSVTWNNETFDDLVLLRADGTPTYMLAVVVDDHDMGITHVIRGDDHLINAGRQSQIYAAMGWDIPEWSHVPLIHGPDGKKLSKRHGALGVDAYQDMGYVPDGLRNYLLKLGWSHGDQELFFGTDAQEVFDLSGLNESPARLDFDKMDFINGQHLLRTDNTALMELAMTFFEDVNKGPLDVQKRNRVTAAIDTLKPRSKTLKDMAEQARYLITPRPLLLNAKVRKSLNSEALERLQDLKLKLASLDYDAWEADNLQNVLDSYASEKGIGFGKVGQPLRAALTGGLPSPDLSQVLWLLGKDETLGRMADVLENENLEKN